MTVILRTVDEVRSWRAKVPRDTRVGLVPTMGALHAGHISLMNVAKQRAERTVASIFVNPLQFGPTEDFSRYPRTPENDLRQLEAAKVDAVFIPEGSSLYADDSSTYVIEDKVSTPMCGAFRPEHFRGVTTVVIKLLNIVQPSLAVFGQKDAQQCAVIERMVRDLSIPVQIVRGPIIRELDGLALSSRNVFLTPEERKAAPRIFQSLQAARDAFDQGERDAVRLAKVGRAVLADEPLFEVQYWDVRDPRSLEELRYVPDTGGLFAVAAFLGKTRLIDNWHVGGA